MTAAEIALEVAAGAPLTVRAGDRTIDLHAEAGWCLAAVRLIVERAHGWRPGALYELFGTHRVEREGGPPPAAWWARDLERSLREQGHAVPIAKAEPGALLFNWRAAVNAHGVYVGHVGILTHGGLVLENIRPEWRPQSLKRTLADGRTSTLVLTPRHTFPTTLAVHLPAA